MLAKIEEHFVLSAKLGVTVRSVRFKLHQRSKCTRDGEPLRFYFSLPILNGRSEFDLHDTRYKTYQIAPVGSRSNASDAFDPVKSWPL